LPQNSTKPWRRLVAKLVRVGCAGNCSKVGS
jgi:hypothetical protein